MPNFPTAESVEASRINFRKRPHTLREAEKVLKREKGGTHHWTIALS